jgi:hypothetical protein
MALSRMHFPLDPDCPEVQHAFQIPVRDEEGNEIWIDDPMGAAVMDELWADFEKNHRKVCERCTMYGAENVEPKFPV